MIISLWLPSLFVLGGCNGIAGPTLDMQSNDGSKNMSVHFDRAYVSRDATEGYDVVLIRDGGPRDNTQSTGPIASAPHAPLQQIVYIHVFWQPVTARREAKWIANAVVDWYVRGADPTDSPGRLHYQGSGMVNIFPSTDGAKLIVRDVAITLRDRQGELADPLGPARIDGSFSAPWNEGMVRSTVSALGPATADMSR